MVHQCVSEDLWFRTILGIDVGVAPLPAREVRWEFMALYAEGSRKRLQALKKAKAEPWWEEIVTFFDVPRSRAWVMTRRMTHTAQHRGQLMDMLRMLGSDMHSTYGPTADTGGLMQNHAPTIYAYPSLEVMLKAEAERGAKAALPRPVNKQVTVCALIRNGRRDDLHKIFVGMRLLTCSHGLNPPSKCCGSVNVDGSATCKGVPSGLRRVVSWNCNRGPRGDNAFLLLSGLGLAFRSDWNKHRLAAHPRSSESSGNPVIGNPDPVICGTWSATPWSYWGSSS
jgi:hypothetical protein